MPFYEYECSNCHFYVEVMQKISDPRLKKCPSCSKNSLKKLLSAPVFRLKGKGWYETDFKSEKEGKRNLASGDKEEAASSAKSESKSEAPASGEAGSDSKSAKPAETAGASAEPKAKTATSKDTARAASAVASGSRRAAASRRGSLSKSTRKVVARGKARRPRGGR